VQGEDGGTFTGAVKLAGGTAPNESGRSGDYSGAAIDWANPADVWVGSEVGDDLGVDSAQWASHVDSVSLSASSLPNAGVHQVWDPGQVYRGQTRQRYRIRIHTGGGGGRAEQIDLSGIALKCRRDYRDRFSVRLAVSPAPPISASGSFRLTQRLRPDRFAHWTRLSVVGVLSYGRINGTVQGREASRHHGLCRSGRVKFTSS
jgi:hypothetical protein